MDGCWQAYIYSQKYTYRLLEMKVLMEKFLLLFLHLIKSL